MHPEISSAIAFLLDCGGVALIMARITAIIKAYRYDC